MNKKNLYIFLTLLCIAGTIFVRDIPSPPQKQSAFQSALSKERLKETLEKAIPDDKIANLFGFVFSVLLYFLFFMFGVLNIILFLIRRARKEPILPISEKNEKFTLTPEKTAQLFFAITFVVFIICSSNLYLYALRGLKGQAERSLILNLTIQIAAIAILVRFLGYNGTKLSFKKIHLLSVLRVYSAVLPLIFLTTIILERLGIKPTPNLPIEILFLLKNKFIIFILLGQIVILAPIAEELLFRAVIYKAMRQKYSFLACSALTSIIFALLHATPGLTGPLFVVSMGLCYIYEKTQNIFSAMTFHAVFNSVNILLIMSLKSLF